MMFGKKPKPGGNKTLKPWGNNIPHPGRSKSRLGQSVSKVKVRKRAKTVTKPDSTLKAVPGAGGRDPLSWPLEAPAQTEDLLFDKTTQAKADFNNAITNAAYKRAGYGD